MLTPEPATTASSGGTKFADVPWNPVVATAYVRNCIETEIGPNPAYGAIAAFARRLGIRNQQSISQLKAGTRGAGIDTFDLFAKLYGKSHDAFMAEAEAWFATQEVVPARAPPAGRGERYPNRALAAEFARRSGVLEEAIALIESVELFSATDPTPRDWLDDIEREARRIERGLPAGKPLSQQARDALRPTIPAPKPKPGE